MLFLLDYYVKVTLQLWNKRGMQSVMLLVQTAWVYAVGVCSVAKYIHK